MKTNEPNIWQDYSCNHVQLWAKSMHGKNTEFENIYIRPTDITCVLDLSILIDLTLEDGMPQIYTEE